MVLQTLIGHTAEVVGIAFSPDGRRIATASFDRTIKLWDTATGSEVFTLRGHTAGLLVLAFSPDGRRIVSGGIDSTARVWDATPLPADVLLAHESRFQRKRKASTSWPGRPRTLNEPETLAQNGQWDLAAAAFGKFVEQEPDNLGSRYPHIRSLVEAGDGAGVRRACEDLLKRFGTATTNGRSPTASPGPVCWPPTRSSTTRPRSIWRRPHWPNIPERGRGGAMCSTPSGLRCIAPAGSRKPSAV